MKELKREEVKVGSRACYKFEEKIDGKTYEMSVEVEVVGIKEIKTRLEYLNNKIGDIRLKRSKNPISMIEYALRPLNKGAPPRDEIETEQIKYWSGSIIYLMVPKVLESTKLYTNVKDLVSKVA